MLENQATERLAIVMPVYNEGETIAKTVEEINEKVMRYLPNSSILIFEDGSKDNTKEVLNSLAAKYPWVKVHTSPQRKGYPTAVRDALNAIDEDRFDYVVFVDSDGQYYPEDFFRLWDAMKKGEPDIVMAQRRNRSEPLYRVVLSSGLRLLERLLFDPPCNDVTSAFRIMKVHVAKSVAAKVRYSKYNFWLEFTARAAMLGYTFSEVPVSYRSREGGESNVYSFRKMPRVIASELGAILRTWWSYKKSEIVKFVGVGASGAAIIIAVTDALTSLAGYYYVLSAAIGIEASIIWAFILNDRWTFQKTRKSHRWHTRFLRYNLISLVGLAINESLLVLFTEIFGIYYLASEIFAIIFTFAFNYIANVKWTWHRPIS